MEIGESDHVHILCSIEVCHEYNLVNVNRWCMNSCLGALTNLSFVPNSVDIFLLAVFPLDLHYTSLRGGEREGGMATNEHTHSLTHSLTHSRTHTHTHTHTHTIHII